VYGCTHYPYLAPVLGDILPSTIQFIDPAEHVVTATEQELELMGLKNLDAPAPTRFCVSGNPQQFAERARHWLGCPPLVEQIQLPTLVHTYRREMSISLE